MLETPVPTLRCRVYFEDTDAGGVVYYARYLHFLERARSEWAIAQGLSQNDLLKRKQALVVRQLSVDYLKSGRLEQELDVHTEVEDVRRCSFRLKQIIADAASQSSLVSAHVLLVAVDLTTMRPLCLRRVFAAF